MRNWVWAQRRGRGAWQGHRADAPISDQAPLVWRVPKGPEGLAAVPVGGGRARAGLEIDHSEPQARVWRSRGRAAAHRHTQRPGPTAGASGARNTRGARIAARPSGPPRTGTHSGRAPQPGPPAPGTPVAHTKQPSGTGRRHDPRLGRQGTQSCNPESIRNVGGATRPGHSQGRPDKRNDVLGGPAQAS